MTLPLTYAAAAAAPSAALLNSNYVYVRRGGVLPPLEPPYRGPYKVIQAGEKTFRLAIGGREEVVSVDWLKPHLGLAPLLPAVPARRGRPPLLQPSSAPSSSADLASG